ncbi:Apolipoprotein N-acyltransferase [Gemmobacter aquatilis]|uniref:Apolipoprotein N-acyltransferase n=2 Tax=Gemmobacter aquatilis TaxID=933059 RepID=A0A1H8J1D8_9RHOB|nr:Apolipoprotein N-acyltransferase [Gemmobacter aquatilis]
MQGWRAAGLALGLGVLAAAGQAPLGAWYLALPAYAGIMALVAWAASPRQAAWRGWLAGAGHFGAALSWIVQPFFVEPEVYGWMAPFALALMGFGLALFWALPAWLAARFGRAGLIVPLLTGAEMLRGVIFTGFPWALPGHIWIDTPVAQLAAYGGANGLTLLVLVLAALPVLLGWRGVAGAAALLAAVWGFGLWRLAQPDPAAPGLTLRLVQPNAAQSLKWDPDQAERLLQLQLDYTAALPRPDLVIWPETALPYLLEEGSRVVDAVAAAGQGVPVALGAQRMEGAAAFNSLVVIGPEATVTHVYDKHHLVPFGEYVPMGELAYRTFGLRAFAARQGYGYAAGPGAAVLDLGHLGKILPLICYEAVFARDLRAAPDRAGWILQITNDAWFGTLTGPFQHAAQARLRAVEMGLPLVRVANTGVTGVTDARGRVTAALPFGVAAYLDAALPGPLPPTPYARWGEAPLLVLLAGLAALLFRRRGKGLA